MRNALIWLLFSAIVFSTACKSEFERVRTSGNPETILNKAFAYYERKQYQKAQTLFDLVLTSLRGDSRAEKAYYEYAYTHYNLKNYLLAAYYFKNFSNTFLNSPLREEAAFMSAYSNYLLSPSTKLEQSSTQTAIDEFQLFTNLFPTSKRVEECNKLIDGLRRKMEEKAFAEGQLYYDLRQYQSAVISFDNLLKDYPETPDAERVRYLIAKGEYLLSENSVVEKKAERYQETIVRCNDFLEKYPTGDYTKEVKNILKDATKQKSDIQKRLKT
jgi:outer membrane protein assembly factor BamD